MKQTAVFAKAAVAAPHDLASQTGRAVLAAGGNAIEAMIGMAATIPVVYPSMNHIGGDGFWIIRLPDGRVRAIEACGFAGEHATIANYRAKGFATIPPRGGDAALTVAGAVGGWIKALEFSASLGGKIPLSDLLYDAEKLCREGVPVSGSETRYIVKEEADLFAAPNFAAHFMNAQGEQPKQGDIRLQPALAGTFEQLKRARLDDFYRGDLAREIAADLAAAGSPVTRADLGRYEARWREPLTTRLPGVQLYNCPPPTQGLASLILHGGFDRLEVKQAESFEHIHGLIEASKRAMAIRDRVVTDFDRLKVDPASFLTEAALAREAAAISMERAAPWPFVTPKGDTIWMGAIDASGMAVSFIQSLYWEYGSGVVLPKTGILWQNRGLSFSLDPKAINPLEPGRRPFHTLNCPLAVFDDGRVVSYGAMGGDAQPQFQAQVFFRALRFGLSIAEAIDRPRFLFGKTWGADSATVKVENRFDPSLLRRLEQVGHVIERIEAPYADMFGHAGMLIRAPDGSVAAAHDPRSDGGAEGF